MTAPTVHLPDLELSDLAADALLDVLLSIPADEDQDDAETEAPCPQ